MDKIVAADLLKMIEALRDKLSELVGTSTDELNGFSSDVTELGGRSHPLMNAAIEEFRAGDTFDQEQADIAAKYFVFSHARVPELAPKEGSEAFYNSQAALSNAFSRIISLPGNESEVLDYRLKLDNPDLLNNRIYQTFDDHGVVYLPPNGTPEAAIRRYINDLKAGAERKRNFSGVDWNQRPR